MPRAKNLHNTTLLPATQKKMVQLMGAFGEGVHTQHELVEAFHKFVTTTEYVVNKETTRPKLSGSMTESAPRATSPKKEAPKKTKSKKKETMLFPNHKMPVRNGRIVAV